MKTQIMFGVVALLFLASMSFVLAEENETPISYGNDSVENVSELADDSSVVSVNESSENESEDNTEIEVELEMNESASNMDVLGQQIKIWFTFNKEKKIDAELKLARLRLIQANIAAKNNHSAAMEKALEAHERILNRVKERITKLDDRSDLKNLNNSAVKLLAMERAIEVHQLRVDHLQNVLANANLTEKQREVL
jgi:ribosome-associated translation inhibitor RaiA